MNGVTSATFKNTVEPVWITSVVKLHWVQWFHSLTFKGIGDP